MRAAVCAQSDVFHHAALTQQAHVLEGAAQPQCGKVARGALAHDLVHQAHLALGGIIHTRDHVEEGALARAVGANQGMHLTGLNAHGNIVVGHQTAKALGHVFGFQNHRATGRQGVLFQDDCALGWGYFAGAQQAARQALQRGPHAVGKALQHKDHQQAKDHHLKVAAGAQQRGQHVLQLLLEQGDHRGTQYRAPQVASATDHGHEQVFNTDVQIEGRWIDEALHVRIQPAGHRRQQGSEHEQLDAVVRGIDTHGLGHDAPPLEGTNSAAFARIEQVVHQPHRHQQYAPNEHAQHAWIGQGVTCNRQGRYAGNTGLPTEELHVAKQVVQAQAPGNRTQR